MKDKLRGYVITSAYKYDQYGNPASEEIKYGGYVASKTTKTYQNMEMPGIYRLGMLTCKEETNTRLDQSVTKRTEITYCPYLLPDMILSFYDDNLVEGVAYLYGGRGKITSEITRSYSSPVTHTTRYQYDEFGHKTVTTDPMSFTTTSGYSSATGLVEFTQDHWGRRTEYDYDGWGRLIRSRHPDGVISSSEMKWNDDPEIDALYVSVSSETGKPVHKTYYDRLGREMRTCESRFNGKYLKTDNIYDEWGRLTATSLPYTTEDATLWNRYNYDQFDRMTSVKYASGKKDSVSYNLSSVTNISQGIASTKTYDASGKMISVEDPGGIVKYYYRADGQLSAIKAPGDVITRFEYDMYGRQIMLDDPSAGCRSYQYDERGNTIVETDAQGRTTRMYYDDYDRVLRKEIVGEMATNYYYDPATALLTREWNKNHTTTYVYDTLDRLQVRRDSIIDNKWLERRYSYDNGNLSRVDYRTQSSGGNVIAAKNYVYRNGHQSEIRVNNTAIWKLVDENNMGMPSQALTGTIQRYYDYDTYGMPVSRRATGPNGTIQNFSYKFDHNTSNLLWRKDEMRGIKEDFSYDHLNRLVSFGDSYLTYDSDGKGNIVANSSIGQFTYGTNKPYQLIGAADQGNHIPLKDQDIVYNAMQRPVSITEHEYNALLTYDCGGDRVRMQVNENDMGILSRYYIDKTYEIESGIGIDKEFLYLDGDAYFASSVYVKENGSWNLYYIFRDYLGSMTHLTDASGTVLEEYSYDAWGRLRNPQTQVLYNDDSQPDLFLRRGYTSHEHLPWFGLTNMNARLYDPVLGRFLSPDPYVQMPDFSQNFNRYAYALNNPLKYIDPDGESFIGAIILGAVLGGIINLNVNAANVTSYGDMFAYFGMGALAGGLGGAAGAGVAGLVGTNSFIGGALTGISGGFAGGFAGGAGSAWMHGADFGEGLNAGLKQGGIGAAAGAVLGGVTGGIRAKSAGGNFWTGKGATHDFFETNYVEKNVTEGPALDYNNDVANDFLHGNFGNPKNLNQLHADGTLPSPEYSMRGGRVWKNGVEPTLGTTVKVGLTKSDVCLYPGAFESPEKLYVIMGHELVHVNVNAAASFIGKERSEATARAWSKIQEKFFNVNYGSASWFEKYPNFVPDWKFVFNGVPFAKSSVFIK